MMFFQGAGEARVQPLALGLEQRIVRCPAYERVLEHVMGAGRTATAKDQLRIDELAQACCQVGG